MLSVLSFLVLSRWEVSRLRLCLLWKERCFSDMELSEDLRLNEFLLEDDQRACVEGLELGRAAVVGARSAQTYPWLPGG